MLLDFSGCLLHIDSKVSNSRSVASFFTALPMDGQREHCRCAVVCVTTIRGVRLPHVSSYILGVAPAFPGTAAAS